MEELIALAYVDSFCVCCVSARCQGINGIDGLFIKTERMYSSSRVGMATHSASARILCSSQYNVATA